MANYSITIGNTFNVFGGGKTNRWGDSYGSGTTLTWQSAGIATQFNFWGSQNDLEIRATKLVSNDLDMSSTVGKAVTKQVDDVLDMTSTVGKIPYKGLSDQLAVATTMSTITKMIGNWTYIYPDNQTNFIQRSIVDWSANSSAETTWATSVAATTSWTEA